MHPNDTTQDIPYGYCHCGCGQKTNLAKTNDRAVSKIKGEPHKYIDGHQNRKFQHLEGANPSGLCMCGCGQPTAIAKGTDIARGQIKGRPVRYIPGHYSRIPRHKNIEAQFWSHCSRGTPDECWEWQASLTQAGYGQITVGGRKGKQATAHRISYELHYGPVPEGMFVCHKCDNPKCCNPNHLFLGTPADNVNDMLKKGRGGYSGNPGEAHPAVKLTEIQVTKIRMQWEQGVSQSEMARQYNVSQTTIWAIVRRKSWTHIP